MKKLILLSLSVFMMLGAVAYADIDNMNIGGDILLEYFFSKEFDLNDNINAPDETDFLRTEIHLWFQADLDDNITARISLEADRAMNNGASNGVSGVNRIDQLGVGDLEVFLEEAFVKAADIFASGVSVSIGRQFLNYGDNPSADDFNRWWGPGFVIADSRSYSPLLLSDLGSYEIDPFDAVVLSYEIEQARIDLIHTRDVEDFYTNNVTGLDDDATMWALYGSYFGIEGHQIDVYVTYNDENSVPGALADAAAFDGKQYIVGGRVAGDITEEVAYKAEVAYQFQDRQSGVEAIEGFGAQAGVNYHPDMDRQPNIGFLYSFMGQDGQNQWNGFFAPYEGKTYGMIAEGLAKLNSPTLAFTNMHVFNLNGGLLLTDDIAWTSEFYYFLIQDDLGTGDDDLGFEFDTQLDYRFNDNLNTFIGGGIYVPDETGDTAVNVDEAYFLRAGVKVYF